MLSFFIITNLKKNLRETLKFFSKLHLIIKSLKVWISFITIILIIRELKDLKTL